MSALQVESEVVGERVEGLSDGLKRTSHVNKHTKVGNYRHSWGGGRESEKTNFFQESDLHSGCRDKVKKDGCRLMALVHYN